ncbi:hypothetical protein ACIBF5_00235 [Micromonospora sp. NPDC050417]|uniref:hypothetical protein n=1 Tax=Micromonospora sp. NPDC050417 TaxID=3364280 RepID=UPI003798C131
MRHLAPLAGLRVKVPHERSAYWSPLGSSPIVAKPSGAAPGFAFFRTTGTTATGAATFGRVSRDRHVWLTKS